MRFERHYDRADLERLFDDSFSLPDGFMFGVANSGFQVEGGFNSPGEPLNNWFDLERRSKVERSGAGIRFWTEYGKDAALASGIGLNAFRLGIEWARVQPSTGGSTGRVPPFDGEALSGYAAMIAHLMRAGLEPVVTLHHFTHPLWLGVDFWLDDGKLELFEEYARHFADTVNTLLVERHGERPVKYWITMNEPNALALGTYLVGYMPHRRLGVRATGHAWGNMIAAHCRTYDALKRLYVEKGWGEPAITYNTAQICVYEFDKVMTDILTARANGIPRDRLAGYLDEGRAGWYREVAKCPEVARSPAFNTWLEGQVERAARRVFDPEDLQTGIDAVYSSPDPAKLDFLAVDFYDPFFRHMIKAPDLDDLREGRANAHRETWEWVLNPRAMYHFLQAARVNAAGLPIVTLENGMAYKVRRGKVSRRADGATRDRFLQCFIFEAMRSLKDGVPLAGYFYWTLVDNYEWGSYDARFGLYTVDREAGTDRSGVDCWGVDAGGVYRELVAALRSGDRDRMVAAFWRTDW